MKAFVTEVARGHFHVGICGKYHDGTIVYRPQFFLRGPFAYSTAMRKKRQLQADLDARRIWNKGWK